MIQNVSETVQQAIVGSAASLRGVCVVTLIGIGIVAVASWLLAAGIRGERA